MISLAFIPPRLSFSPFPVRQACHRQCRGQLRESKPLRCHALCRGGNPRQQEHLQRMAHPPPPERPIPSSSHPDSVRQCRTIARRFPLLDSTETITLEDVSTFSLSQYGDPSWARGDQLRALRHFFTQGDSAIHRAGVRPSIPQASSKATRAPPTNRHLASSIPTNRLANTSNSSPDSSSSMSAFASPPSMSSAGTPTNVREPRMPPVHLATRPTPLRRPQRLLPRPRLQRRRHHPTGHHRRAKRVRP